MNKSNLVSNPNLRFKGAFDDVYWPTYSPSRSDSLCFLGLLCCLAFWATLIATSVACLGMPSVAGVLGLVLVVRGYRLIRRDVYEEPDPVLDRDPAQTDPNDYLLGVALAVCFPGFVVSPVQSSACVFLALFFTITHFAVSVGRHFVWYISARNHISVDRQEEVRKDFEQIVPSTNNPRLVHYRMTIFVICVASSIVALCVFIVNASMFASHVWFYVAVMAAVPFFVLGIRRDGHSTAFFALQVFANSPAPVDATHPTWSSHGGQRPTQLRRTHMAAACVLVASLAHPLLTPVVLRIANGSSISLPEVAMNLSVNPSTACFLLLIDVVTCWISGVAILLLFTCLIVGRLNSLRASLEP